MSIAVEKTKILIVDIEMAMLNVLKNFSEQHQYNSRCYFDPAEACTALAHRKYQGEKDYRCVLLGWPDVSIGIIRDLLDALESPEHRDLPLVIVCHEVNAEIQKLLDRRPNTHTVQWKQHKTAADLIARYTTPVETMQAGKTPATRNQKIDSKLDSVLPGPVKALLLDDTPTVSSALRGLMESNGYQVTVARGSIAGLNRKARQLLDDINRRDLTGQSFAQTVCGASIEVEAKNTANFKTSSGSEIAVTYMAQHIRNGSSTGILLTFNPQPMRFGKDKKGSPQVVVGPKPVPTVAASESVDRRSLAAAIATVKDNHQKQAVVECDVTPGKVDLKQFAGMLERVARAPEKDVSYGVLLLDIQLIAATNDRLSVGDSEPMLGIVSKSLASVYTRDHTFSYIGNGQFMYLFAVTEQQEALVLTRKLLKLVPQMVKYLSNMTLVSHSSLLQLSVDRSLDASLIVKKCRRGAARARLDKRDNCALVHY